MAKKGLLLIVILIIIILAVGAVAYFVYKLPNKSSDNNGKIACTTEAKLCPDGSYVARTGLNCEFAPCPAQSASGIKGLVLLGPVCPVVKNPPDSQCADKPYSTKLAVSSADQPKIIKQFSSGQDGKFSVNLDPGQYIIIAAPSTTGFPRCSSRNIVDVVAGQYADTVVFCDSGIR